MLQKIKTFFYNLLLKERSPEKLARSFSLALYISFSPWIGMQYPLVFILSWLFSLNTAVLVATASVISNPITYVPVCVFDYTVGYWFLHSLLKIPVASMNPAWMERFNSYLTQTLGTGSVSVWAFIVGGNLVGITLALISYPISKYLFSKIAKERA